MALNWFHLIRNVTAAALCTICLGAHAQGNYPSRPVRFLLPFTTGGAADIAARLMSEKLAEIWKQQVIVDNRPGAGGNVGLEAGHKSPADGHTIVMISNSNAINVNLYDKLAYDLVGDFAPVTLVANASLVLVAHPRVTASNMAALVGQFRDGPGKFTYASCGNGTVHHFAMELIKFQTKTFVVHVPYRGCSQGIIDVVGGQVDTMLVTLGTALPHIRAGRIKAIALTNSARTPAAPEIQTIRESGVPELAKLEIDNWYALLVPTGTPRDINEKIAADAKRVLAMPDIQKRMGDAGMEVLTSTPDEQMRRLKADILQFKRVIEFAGIKPG